ncbi:hypothetical protein ACUXZZ_09550 [Streptomyces graminifolii]|uniref:hypothetical protein n=1 Tax=Streptomyces graminifolii TaxID=1266771 RepID=UPI00405A4564
MPSTSRLVRDARPTAPRVRPQGSTGTGLTADTLFAAHARIPLTALGSRGFLEGEERGGAGPATPYPQLSTRTPELRAKTLGAQS